MSYMNTILPDIVLILILFFIYYAYLFYKKDPSERMRYFALFLSATLIFYFTLMPFLSNIPNISSNLSSLHYNYEPFIDWKYQYGTYTSETIYNIILFIPFGFCYALATKKNFLYALVFGLLTSVTIELLQPIISDSRIGDVTDVINNCCGMAFGYLLYYLLSKLKISNQ